MKNEDEELLLLAPKEKPKQKKKLKKFKLKENVNPERNYLYDKKYN